MAKVKNNIYNDNNKKHFFQISISILLIIVTIGSGIFVFSNFNSPSMTHYSMVPNDYATPNNSQALSEFYALAFHWGYVLYDKNLNEIRSISVSKGSNVKIHLLSASELTEELHEQIEQNDLNNTVGLKHSQTEIMEAMESAENSGLLTHGLSISGPYMMSGSIKTNEVVTNATSIQNLVSQLTNLNELPTLNFVATRTGSFGFYCTVPCGEYHSDMYINNVFNVN